MLYGLKGYLREKTPTQCIIGLKLGETELTLELLIPVTTYEKLGGEGSLIQLFVYPVYKEDGITLYGFKAEADRKLFARLLKISGIGPHLALQVLSYMNAAKFIQAVSEQNFQDLKKIKGMGKKRLERLIFELKDEFPGIDKELQENESIRKAREALKELGLGTSEMERALHASVKKLGMDSSPEELIKEALQWTRV